MDNLSCSVCKFIAFSKPGLDEHLLDHYSPKKFKCEQCFFLCRTQDVLDKHVKLFHTEFRKFRCTNCSYAVNSYQRLKVHMKRGCMDSQDETDDDDYEGRSTGRKEKGYRYRSKVRKYDSFKLYSKPHLNLAPYPTATVSSRDEYVENKKTVTCSECGYPADSEERLESHRRVHDSFKPYECQKCSYKGFNKAEFNDHVRSHSEKCKFRCGDCDYATNHYHAFKLHLKRNKHFAEMLPISDDLYDYNENVHQLSEDVNNAESTDRVRSQSEECKFRCGDCDYATNHQHAFKLHLKRNKHFAEIMLISDDSPVHNEDVHQLSEDDDVIEIIEI